MLQKEQVKISFYLLRNQTHIIITFFSFIKLRALQGQKRALLALKKRSEQRLIEQQELINKQTTNPKEELSENNLLGDISNLRDRYREN